jgi:hypothetical protein
MIVPQICNSTHAYENRSIDWFFVRYILLAYFLCLLADVDFWDHRVVRVGVSIWTFKNLTEFHVTSCENYDFWNHENSILITVVCVSMSIWTFENTGRFPWNFLWKLWLWIHQSSVLLIVVCVVWTFENWPISVLRVKVWLWNPPLLIC